MSKAFLKDLAERVGFTFLQAFLSALLLSTQFDISALQTAAIAGLAAGLAALKGIVATKVGDPDSASFGGK